MSKGHWFARMLASSHFMPIAATLCLLLIGANVVGLLALSGNWPPAFVSTQSQISITGPGAATPTPIHASVLGAVFAPGLYTLQAGAHVSDLIEAGGGALTTADRSNITLGATVRDGDLLHVRLVGETLPVMRNGKVDLNVATAEQLHDALGITLTVARRIVACRAERGSFTSVSQLLLVPVTQATFDRIKDLVTV